MARPGRPRSETARQATLAALVALIEEDGYGAVSMQAIARRAGVSKQTLYRWWPSKAAILLEVLNAGAGERAPLPEPATLDEELQAFVSASVLGARGRTGRLLRALMSEAQADPAFAPAFREGFLARRRAVLVDLLERARARGEVPANVDLSFLAEIMFGTLWYRLLADSGPIDRAFAQRLAAALLTLAR